MGRKLIKGIKKYPLFVFRDITYLPMTWSIFHDELDYDVSFNHKDGLVMKAKITSYVISNDWDGRNSF